MPKSTINIQKLVRQRLEDDGRTVAWLCRKLNWRRAKMYRFFDTGKIDVADLHKISIVVEYDFFQYFSKNIAEKI